MEREACWGCVRASQALLPAPQAPAGGLRPPDTCPPDRVPPTEELLLSLNTKKLIKKTHQAASQSQVLMLMFMSCRTSCDMMMKYIIAIGK